MFAIALHETGIVLFGCFADLEEVLLGLRHPHALRLLELVEFAADLHLGGGRKSSSRRFLESGL